MSGSSFTEVISLTSDKEKFDTSTQGGKPSVSMDSFEKLISYLNLEICRSRSLKTTYEARVLITLEISLLEGRAHEDVKETLIKLAPYSVIVFRPALQTTSAKNPSSSGK